MTVINIARRWSELLDIAADGGVTASFALAGNGRGYLAFDFWEQPTLDAVSAAHEVSSLFDRGGPIAREIFEHFLDLGGVYRSVESGHCAAFNGPLRGSASDNASVPA